MSKKSHSYPNSPQTPNYEKYFPSTSSSSRIKKNFCDWDKLTDFILQNNDIEGICDRINKMAEQYFEYEKRTKALFPWKMLVQRILTMFPNDLKILQTIFTKSLINIKYKKFGPCQTTIMSYNNELIGTLCGYHVHEVLALHEFEEAIINEHGSTKGYTFLNCVFWPRSFKYGATGYQRTNDDITLTLTLLMRKGCSPERRNESNGGETSIGSLLESKRKNQISEKIFNNLYNEITNINNFNESTFGNIMISICNKISDDKNGNGERKIISDWLCWAFSQDASATTKYIFKHIYKTAPNIIIQGSSDAVSKGIQRVIGIFTQGPQLDDVVVRNGTIQERKKTDFSLYFNRHSWNGIEEIKKFNSIIVEQVKTIKPSVDDNWCNIMGAFVGECGTNDDILNYVTKNSIDLYENNYMIHMNIITCIAHAKSSAITGDIIQFIDTIYGMMNFFCQTNISCVLANKFGLDVNLLNDDGRLYIQLKNLKVI